jgi:hypothetical protein
MTINQQIQQLAPYREHSNPRIAEYAQTVSNYAMALSQGKLTAQEYQSLLGDLSALTTMARTADEATAVADLHTISRAVISLL